MSLSMSRSLSEKDSTSVKDAADSAKDLECVTPDDAAFERRTIRRVDLCILPLFGLLFAVAQTDRSNLGVARTVGMGVDLRLDIGNRFSTVSCLFFVPYILLQLPGNILLRSLGVRNWLSFIVITWGAVQLAMGFVPSWGFLTLCRVLLGALEGSFFPSLVFIVSTWYKRHETQKRLAGFYLISVLISSFAPILAYGISRLNGKRGLAGWAWVFIIEGAFTMLLGLVTFVWIPDFPHKNRFLSQKQTELVLQRVEEDRGDSVPDPMTARKIIEHASDWTVWACALMSMCATMPSYAIQFFVPTILNGMGWDVAHSLLLSAPPYAFAFVSAFFFAWLSDKTKKRAIFIAAQSLLTMVGLFITAYAPVNGARYFGIYLTSAGAAGCIPAILTYSANNVVSHSKRAVSIAIIISFGGVGGIFATTVFRQQDAPTYLPGLWATIGCQFFMMSLLALTTMHFWRMNNKALAGKLDRPLEGQPGFLYTL